jgi:hypothetical protein
MSKRAHKRELDRRNQYAYGVFSTLTQNFFDFFITNPNPNGDEVIKKRDQLNAQWLTYCKRSSLNPEAYKMIEEYTARLINEYRAKAGVRERVKIKKTWTEMFFDILSFKWVKTLIYRNRHEPA